MEKAKEDLVKLMKHLRRFNDDDYDGFAGAESVDPLVNDHVTVIENGKILKNCIMIIDDKAVEIYYYPYFDDPDDEDYLEREEGIFYHEFGSEETVKIWLEHEAKNLEGEGVSVDVLQLYGFQTY